MAVEILNNYGEKITDIVKAIFVDSVCLSTYKYLLDMHKLSPYGS